MFWKLTFIVQLMLMFSLHAAGKKLTKYAVYYDDQLTSDHFFNYDLVVFDSEHHPPIKPLIERKITVLGYLSAGEISDYRPHYKKFKEMGILGEENKNWPGSYFVDVRNPQWTAYIIENMIPDLLHKGFSGVFLDTLDNPPHLERTDPDYYKGMTKAAENMVKTIRYHYPYLKIMVNRGYELMPEVGSEINMLMAESLYSDYNFDNKTYQKVPDDLYNYQMTILKKLMKTHPKLEIYSLDYWNTDDTNTLKSIYSHQRKSGFIPYVSTVELDKLIKEP